MADDALVKRAKSLLDRLSRRPRFVGSDEESQARSLCREELERAGFSCREIEFAFSEWPGRWGPPIASGAQLAILLLTIVLSARGQPITGLLLAALFTVGLSRVARWMRRRGVIAFPYQRSHSANLEAVRGNPLVWLVAHLDSKSQTVPMLVRIESTVALQLVSLLTVAAVAAAAAGIDPGLRFWLGLSAAAAVAALPSMLCIVGNRSPGALDNATGVASVLLAAAASGARDLGVLITSGEELGLAGARAWARNARSPMMVVNCDTVDDVGSWRCMYSGGNPVVATAGARRAGETLGIVVSVGRLIPGILADNVAFADAGIGAITVSRGNFSTLARIHTWRDTSIGLTGRGVADASELISALASELSQCRF